MLGTATGTEELTLTIAQEIHVNAPLETTFAALLEQLTTASEHPDGTPMPMKLEPRPGGRWYRDIGGDNGHYWGTVQAIKRPTLLEMYGPLFMSYPVINNVQYRLSEVPGGTLITFRHSAFGLIQEEHRKGVNVGWNYIHEQARLRAERLHADSTR
ncbi:MAG: SRPBCC domain-containing protein [Acidobacteriota bacterium]|nr:SRPBCC domain-containing protein [Acidobacteriota bacterium]